MHFLYWALTCSISCCTSVCWVCNDACCVVLVLSDCSSSERTVRKAAFSVSMSILSCTLCHCLSMNVSIYQSIITQILKHKNIVKWGIPDSTLFSKSSGQGYQVSVMLLFRSGSLSARESLNSQSVIFQIGKKTPFRINDCMLSRANEFGTPESCIQLSWIFVFHCSINWGEGTSCA